jgi:phosphatidate cytidylyltransferase
LKNLLQRTVSGIVYLIIIIGSLFLGEYAAGTVILLIGIKALLEFYEMTGVSGAIPWKMLGIVGAGAIYILSFLVASQLAGYQILALAGIIPVLLLITGLYLPKTDLIKDLGIAFWGLVYIIVPLSLMNYLFFPACNSNVYTHRIVLGILTLVWINDTGAYVSGTLLGRHKLFPRVSPKKSWEGLIGGTLLTLAASPWMNSLMGILTLNDWIYLALIVSIFSVYGDLTESLIKRNADRKDSGSLMPGHGGALDRIDSILFVMPFSFIYLIINGL